MNAVKHTVDYLWRTNRPLTFAGLLMLAAFAPFVAGLLLDDRIIGGAPAWLKPAKFAISTAIYTLTLAWVFSFLPAWSRTRLMVGWMTAVIVVGEVAVIAVQAWRGTTSHFNVGTPLDATLFAAMGIGIALQTIGSVFVAIALWRQPIAERALGIALRAGMVVTILGASSAGLMTRPTGAQMQQLRDTGRLAAAGAHTVGAPDGGRGIPGTGWSRDHGDLRIPHFIGLHALQVLPVVAILARRRRTDVAAARVVRVATASYVALFCILLLEALRGEPLLAPGATTLTLLVVWGVTSSIGIWLAANRDSHSVSARSMYAGSVNL